MSSFKTMFQEYKDFFSLEVINEFKKLGVEPKYEETEDSWSVTISLPRLGPNPAVISAKNNSYLIHFNYPNKDSEEFREWAEYVINEIKRRTSFDEFPVGVSITKSLTVVIRIYITLLAFQHIFITKPLVFNEIRKIVNRAEEEFFEIFPHLDRKFRK